MLFPFAGSLFLTSYDLDPNIGKEEDQMSEPEAKRNERTAAGDMMIRVF